jgi:succinate dehydrogenase hydrophobic anchor subunit
MSPTVTAIIMAVFVVSFIGVDIYLAVDKVSGNTYSERMRAWAKVWPPLRLIVAFGMGMLCGHWWWSSAT